MRKYGKHSINKLLSILNKEKKKSIKTITNHCSELCWNQYHSFHRYKCFILTSNLNLISFSKCSNDYSITQKRADEDIWSSLYLIINFLSLHITKNIDLPTWICSSGTQNKDWTEPNRANPTTYSLSTASIEFRFIAFIWCTSHHVIAIFSSPFFVLLFSPTMVEIWSAYLKCYD